ncbi:rhamnulokinase [Photobacterium rosenbergii]|uniref:Rhamnulokinase n=1 Tax=Photobacterium rosenbergii TaxID=294936 RepID=A0ABU3ZNM2_9GAMM|nr:rhamnulokinase [Photobacterium rosenbergii]MDV5171627.1 rhamnulokinase [Photobacterium rosenbergii]
MKAVIAIDLGASSGRVMVGYLKDKKIELEEFHRFKNQQVMRGKESCWDLDSILTEIKTGIDKVNATGIEITSLGIDTWGVDFVLLDKEGNNLGEYVSYRDTRTEGVMDKLLTDNQLSLTDVYKITGIQFLTFNTLYQLKAIADQQPAWFADIDTLLFVPDYLNYKLSGVKHCEYTNASTSQLLNCQEKTWNQQLIDACGAKKEWFLPAEMPNRIIGQYRHGDIEIPVCSVASHDTASAVAATPISGNNMAYLSSGTWSLLGIESEQPYTGEQAYQYNLTNEGGVDGRYRVLKNIMGLWLIQRVKAENPSLEFSDIAMLARHAEPFKYIVNPNDNDFLNPSSMTAAFKEWFNKRELTGPQNLSEVIRCIYDSLTLAYADVLTQLAEVTGKQFDELRIVGGGTQDQFLNQLVADVCQIMVSTEPTEASALGNVVNQFIASDVITSLGEARQIIDASSEVKYFTPRQIDGLEQAKSLYQQITK